MMPVRCCLAAAALAILLGQPAGLALPAISPASTDRLTLGVPGRASATPSIASDGSRVVLAWGGRDAQGAADVYVAVSNDGGRAFGDAVRLTSLVYNGGSGEVEITKGVCYCCKTAIATDAKSRVFTAWRHVYPGNLRDIAFSMSADGGRTFAPPIRVSEDQWQLNGCPDDGPAMSVDAAGVAHIVWSSLVERPEPHKQIFYSWTEDGRSFAPRMRITVVGRQASHPQVVSHLAGVTVLWDEVADGTRRVFAMRRSRSNRNFAPIALSDGAAAATYPVAAVSGEAIVAAWVEGGGADSRIAVRQLPIH